MTDVGAQHMKSPLPWTVGAQWADGICEIRDSNGDVVLVGLADAEYIVRAVNSHSDSDLRKWALQLEDENRRLRDVIGQLQQELRDLKALLDNKPTQRMEYHT
jgi:hypothetical protein